MAQNNQALKVALAAVQQLSLKQQKQLAERLISSTMSDQRTTVVYLHRLSSQKQARLTVLMDKHSENRLSQSERRELRRLGSEVDELMLANSQALAKVLRPELFDERGKPFKQRFQQALRKPSFSHSEPRSENAYV